MEEKKQDFSYFWKVISENTLKIYIFTPKYDQEWKYFLETISNIYEESQDK